jgi:LysM repeat protein
MSSETQSPAETGDNGQRCPQCDTFNAAEATQCKMCAAALQPVLSAEKPSVPPEPNVRTKPNALRERLSKDKFLPLKALLILVCVMALILAIQAWRNPDPIAALLYANAATTSPTPTRTRVPTATPQDVQAVADSAETPTAAPTATPTPEPTSTPRDPRFHEVTSGETLISIALFYGLDLDSVVESNGIDPSTLQAGQTLSIPWPTPTPPLVPVEVEINGQLFIADPIDCERYTVLEGDSLFGIATLFNLDLQAILAANRLEEQSLISPGDTICIPQVYESFEFGDDEAGDSAENKATPTPSGPRLLYPQPDADLTSNDPPVLQWLAQKDLAPDEQYMVEVTNLSAVDTHPLRQFTRNTSLKMPEEWQPPAGEQHQFRWRVRIVLVTGERDDGELIYSFGGPVSSDEFFTWTSNQ